MTYDFDKIMAEPLAPAAPTAPAAPVQTQVVGGGYDFDKIMSVPAQDDNAKSAALFEASFGNPTEEAKKKKLSESIQRMTGAYIAPSVMDVKDAERQFRQHEADHATRASPRTSAFLSNAENAKIAMDDAKTLAQIEAASSYLWGSTKAGAHDLAGAMAKLVDAANPFTLSDSDAAVLFRDQPEKLKQYRDQSATMSLSRFAREQTAASTQNMKDVSPAAQARYGDLKYATTDAAGAAYLSPVKLVSDAVRSLPTSVALMLTTYLTRGAAVQAEKQALATGATAEAAQAAAVDAAVNMAVKFGAGSEGTIGYAQQALQTQSDIEARSFDKMDASPEFQRLVSQGYDKNAARMFLAARAGEQAGVGAGFVDAITNAIGGKFLGKIIGEGGRLLPRIAKGFGNEAGVEFVQSGGEQLFQNMATQANADPAQNLSEGVLESMLQGLFVGGLTGGAFSGVLGRAHKAEAAQSDGAQLLDLAAKVAESETRRTHPPTFDAFFQDVTEGATVFIDPDKLTEALAESKLDLATVLPTAAAAIANREYVGTGIEIPVSELISGLAGTGFEQAVIEHVRKDPDAMTIAEANKPIDDQMALYQEAVEKALKTGERSAEFNSQIQQIQDDVATGLDAIGAYSPTANKTQAKAIGAFYAVLADKVGVTPLQLRDGWTDAEGRQHRGIRFSIGGATTAARPAAAPAALVPAAEANAQRIAELDAKIAELEGYGGISVNRVAELRAERATLLGSRTDGTDATVGASGFSILHGSGNQALGINDIQIVRADGQKQGKKGRVYGGLYGTALADIAQAEQYASMMGGQATVHEIRLVPGTKVLNKTGDITRLSEKYISELVSQGYGLVVGKDPRGRTEYVVIDKAAVAGIAPHQRQQDTLSQGFSHGNAMLNVGLSVGTPAPGAQTIDAALVKSELAKMGVQVLSGEEVPGQYPGEDGKMVDELTYVPHLSRPLTADEMMQLTAALQQEAIPQYHNGIGALHGTPENLAKYGGAFNPMYFKDQKGVALSDALAQSMSSRRPTTKKAAEDHLGEVPLTVDYRKIEPEKHTQNMALVAKYPGIRFKARDAVKRAEEFIQHVTANLLWLHDQIPADIRQRSKLWYDGARALTDRWTAKYGKSDAQIAAVLAVYSPQKDWFMNVSLAERTLDIVKNQQGTAWSPEMTTVADAILADEKFSLLRGAIEGKTLGELTDKLEQAAWLRVFDEAHNNRGHRLVTPEGGFVEFAKSTKDVEKKISWPSFPTIVKALYVLEDGRPETIDRALGGEHKVRSFYNNIYHPNSNLGFVTIDTHAVAAGLLRPLSGTSTEVSHNFGSKGTAQSAATGMGGTYAYYQEAYRRAAEARGLLPREIQSITWEAVRELYTIGFKHDKAKMAVVDKLWSEYEKGKRDIESVRAGILNLAGGVEQPAWVGHDSGISPKGWASSYTGELLGDSVPGRTTGAVDTGTGERAATGGPADRLYQDSPAVRAGAVSGPVVGVHYSKEARTALSSAAFGTGMKGAEQERVAASPDPRIKQRIAFYVNTGAGITPETGVGGQAHVATLTNLYDADADVLKLWRNNRGDLNAAESAVLDAGFDGYLKRDGLGAAVLLGRRSQAVQPLAPDAKRDAAYSAIFEATDAGPFDGGCVVTAQAIQKQIGGTLVALTKDDVAQHAAVLLDDRIYDFNGGTTEEGILARFSADEGVSVDAVRPLRDADLPDAPRSAKDAVKISKLLPDMLAAGPYVVDEISAPEVPTPQIPAMKAAAIELATNKNLISGRQTAAEWKKDLTRIDPEMAAKVEWEKLDQEKLFYRQDLADTLWQGSEPWYYSQLTRALESAPAKVFTSGKAVAQWLRSNAGKMSVKTAEIEATGITDWLETQSKVTKEDVVAFMAQGGVQLQEVVLGAVDDGDVEAWWNDEGGANEEIPFEDLSPAEQADAREQYRADVQSYGDNGGTKFEGYRPPGGIAGTYRERLLTLPSAESDRWNLVKPLSDATAAWRDAVEEFGPGNGPEPALRAERMRLAKAYDEASDVAKADFKSAHWDQPNVIAHVRYDYVMGADGKRHLRIIEIQSDWGQKGKKEGFGGQAEFETYDTTTGARVAGGFATFTEAQAAVAKGQNVRNVRPPGVPTAPFVTDTQAWVALAIKRMLRVAVDENAAGIVFATGQQNAELYDLSKQVDHVVVDKTFSNNTQGYIYVVSAYATAGSSSPVVEREAQTPDEIADIIGKDATDKVLKDMGAGQHGELNNADLKVGGEGMRAFYDEIVPQVANKVLKSIGGGKVGVVSLVEEDTGTPSAGAELDADVDAILADTFGDATTPAREPSTVSLGGAPGFPITKAMREAIGAGLPLFAGQQDVRRGSFSPATMDLRLLADANLSTFLHEASHWFLAAYTQVASEPGAPQALVDEVNALLAHLFTTVQGGAQAGGDLAQQVDYARWKEGYSAEGMLFGGSRDASRLRIAEKDAPIRKLIPATRQLYNDIRRELGLPEVSDWTKRPDRLVQHVSHKDGSILRQDGDVPAPGPLPPGATPLEQWNNMTLDQQVGTRAVDVTSPEFKNWFGGSKVVDADGQPLRMYHTSTGSFDTFKTQRGDIGIHFGTQIQAEARFELKDESDPFASELRGVTHNTIPAYLSLQSPLRLPDLGSWQGAYAKAAIEKALGVKIPGSGSAQSLKAAIQKAGYDGVVYENTKEDPENPADSYIAFDSTQIKSTISNTGEFSRTDPSILRQDGDVPAPTPLPPGATPLEQWNSMSLDQQRPYHEAWAESGEQYFMTGKAPSLALDSVFRTFANWLKRIYGSLKEFVAQHSGVPQAGGDLAQQVGTKPVNILSAAFKRWFGDSKVVDADGKPLRVYRGTTVDTDVVDGYAFFTPNPETASNYGNAEGGNVMPVYLSLQNPAMLEMLPPNRPSALARRLRGLQNKGHDGVIVAYGSDNKPMYISFSPTQVKSAVSNTGKFSRTDPSILHAGGKGTGVKLHPTTAAFFDRMLATEAEIQQANEARGYVQLFKDAAEAGMTENQWAAYQAMDADQREDAEAMLRARSLRDMKWLQNARTKIIGAMQKEAEAQRKAVREQIATELAATPLRLAVKWLKKGEMIQADGTELKVTEGYKMSKDGIDEIFPEGALTPRPDLSALRGMTAKEGLHPDLVAEMFGFRSGEALVRDLLEMKPFKEEVEELTDLRMLQDHSELIDPAAIERAADEAIHNDARTRMVATELAALAKGIGSPVALMKAAKEYARQLVETKTSKTLKPWSFAAAETRAGKAALTALRKGKRDEAAQQKRLELLNHVATKQAYAAEAEVKKIIDRFKRIAGYKDSDSAFKSRDAELVNAVRAILADFGIGTKGKSAREYLAVVAQHNPDLAAVLSDTIDSVAENAKDWRELKISEVRDLAEEIEGLWFLAKRSKQIEIDGKIITLKEAQQAIYDRLDELGIPDRVPGEGSAVTAAEKRGIMFDRFVGALRRVESWVGAKDGALTGPFRTYMWNPIRDAADAYRADKARYLKAYRDLLAPIAPSLTRRLIDAPEIGYVFGKDEGGMGKIELLHAILHTGNDSNKRKLLLGRQWATERTDGTLDTSKWDAFLQRMHNEGVLTKADYDFAQGVWDLLESMKPMAQKAHRDVFGKYFAEVTANAFTNQFGTYAGGYVPAMTDPLIVRDQDLNKMREAEEGNMAYAFPTTAKGFTKSRVEYNRPLKLDLRTLSTHIDKVLLFSHMTRPTNDVRRVMSGKSVAQALGRVDPQAYNTLLLPWLNRAAKQVVETQTPGREGLGRFWSVVRARAGMAAMFANVANSVQQITGLSLAAVRVRPGLLMDAMVKFTISPRETAAYVAGKSKFMTTRLENEVSQMASQINEILVNPSVYESAKEWTNKHAYFMQSAVDSVIGPVVWLGGYNQAIEAGMSELDAVRAGDSAVRETQGSQAPEDIAAFETGSAFYRMFTQFAGYFNMNANLLGTEFVKLSRDMGLKKGAGRGLYVLTLGLLAPAIVGELIMQLFKGGPDDDDKDGEYLDDWLTAILGYGVLRYATAMVPGVGPAINATVNTLNNKPYDDRISTAPAISMVESAVKAPIDLYKAIVEDGKPSKAIKEVATLISMTVGMPASGAAKPVSYLADVAAGRVAPTSAGDAIRGTITGTASPASKQ